RRHTRFDCDWSSDVCSSDLAVIGGDYGFIQSPQGTNAKDLKHFVDLLGYSPSEAMVCATKYGGEIMGMGDELGQVKEGFIADLQIGRASCRERGESWGARAS